MDASRSALISFLGAARQELAALAESLSPDELGQPVEGGRWNVKDTLAHLVSSEAGLVATATRIVNGQVSAQPGFDLDVYNQRQVEKRRGQTVDELLAELETSRAQMLTALEQVSDEQLSARGYLSSGIPTDVLGIFRRIGDHERMHCQQIRGAIGRK